MNRIKLPVIVVVLFSFLFSIPADAQGFLFKSYTGNKPFIELPQAGHYAQFEATAGQEIPIGLIEAENLGNPLEVRLFITTCGDWNLRFYSKTKLKAYLYFGVENGEALFKGMWIRSAFRNKGLSKTLFKYYALFSEHFGLKIATTKIYKPLMARVVMGVGLLPRERTHRVLILNGQGREVAVFPVNFELDAHLIESQHMRVLPFAPEEGTYVEVFVNTAFYLPTDLETIERFWEHQEELGGRHYLYIRNTPLLVLSGVIPTNTQSNATAEERPNSEANAETRNCATILGGSQSTSF